MNFGPFVTDARPAFRPSIQPREENGPSSFT